MSDQEVYQKDIESIRKLMERSVKFLSLSGLSGILAGVYALIGAAVAWYRWESLLSSIDYHTPEIRETLLVFNFLVIAIVVLVASLLTGYWISQRKARREGLHLWDSTAKRLLLNLSIPLVAGGLFTLFLLSFGFYAAIVPALLIFYGLALLQASPNLYDEVRSLGYSEIVLGFLAAAIPPGYGLVLWATGFGVCHIVYGALMYKKYDEKSV
jgi:hypothetical protein